MFETQAESGGQLAPRLLPLSLWGLTRLYTHSSFPTLAFPYPVPIFALAHFLQPHVRHYTIIRIIQASSRARAFRIICGLCSLSIPVCGPRCRLFKGPAEPRRVIHHIEGCSGYRDLPSVGGSVTASLQL